MGTCNTVRDTIFQGEDKSIQLRVVVKPATISFNLSPLDPLTAGDDLTFKFTKEDGTFLEKKLSVEGDVELIDASLGSLRVNLTAADTMALETGNSVSFFAEYLFGGKTRIIKFRNQLNIVSCNEV